jgi:hypothetical protein
MKGCWMAESLDDDRGESYNDTSCVAPSKYAVPRISLPQPHNYESDSHSHEPQSHVDQRKYGHLADSTPLLGTPGTARNFLKAIIALFYWVFPPDTASNPGMSRNWTCSCEYLLSSTFHAGLQRRNVGPGLFWFLSSMPKIPNDPNGGNDDYKYGGAI